MNNRSIFLIFGNVLDECVANTHVKYKSEYLNAKLGNLACLRVRVNKRKYIRLTYRITLVMSGTNTFD